MAKWNQKLETGTPGKMADREVTGTKVGPFGVVRLDGKATSKTYQIDHLPTGYRIYKGGKYADVVKLARTLNRRICRDVWLDPDPLANRKERREEFLACHEIVYGWAPKTDKERLTSADERKKQNEEVMKDCCSRDREKLVKLAKEYGYRDVYAMIEKSAIDSLVPGICMEYGCDYSTDVEPDARENWCDGCGRNTVKSCLEIAFC